ncbi:protein-glutamate O-methyltransferase CheR [Massilia sp. CF038]|uniref:CheR family methyltransferase n=1 Tax=Massilia sp. CF038 TaxID=1881045 RepID=UPI000917DD1F|nr:protein-glutamate O-methyltransferase CheR [Massilia sp. CF038]SHH12831.1 chemotaxis protein methyltransferase WspC [Massilia sp. CF038]
MNPRDLLQRETGLDLNQLTVDRAVAQRIAALGLADPARYPALLNGDELQALAELVVIPESWMFRDPEAFFAAARFVSQRLATHPLRTVRILSIPCAGGEEPYSMAMALQDAGVDRGAFRIDAVDLSEVALARARQGRYTRNAFRGGNLAFRERYFTQVGSEYQIDPALREQVNFSHGNLLTIDAAASSGRYDIVFCRNLLIYFDEATTNGAIARLRLMLADDGLLFAGYAEVPAFCSQGFTPMRSPGAFALQKERRSASRVAQPQPAAAVVPAALRPAPRVPAPAPSAPTGAAHAAASAPAARNPAASVAEQLEQASSLADSGELAAAAALCHQLLQTEPGAAEAYFILGMISECQNKPGVADGYWRRCIYLQPDHYQALCHLALLAEQQGDATQAAALRQRAARVYGRHGGVARSLP